MPSKKLKDVLDEMNLKEDTANKMVVDKLEKLAKLIFDVDKHITTGSYGEGPSDDVQFVSTIVEDLIESPHKRITTLEIEKCNRLYKQYKELK